MFAHPIRLPALLFALALAASLAACGGSEGDPARSDVTPIDDVTDDAGADVPIDDVAPDGNPDVLPDAGDDTGGPPTGQTDFVSADGNNGEESATDDESAGPGRGEDSGGDDRSVEEGDIYRVAEGGILVNLNSWRGVQVIDVSEPETPTIVGRLRVSGTPVEMYVVDDRAYVLLNNWRGYYGVRGDVAVDTREGGLVLVVDISDPSAPAELDRAYVPGYIQTSRLTRGSTGAALYVANSAWAEWPTPDGGTTWESRTIVQSFDVSEGTLEPVTQLDLGGYVADIQATTEALLVARNYYDRSESFSRVAVIDISDPQGEMVEVGEVRARGYVRNQFNMDYSGGVLRVVSDGRWADRETNHLETFDGDTLEPIDHCTFGDGESLFATLFLEDRAFFVTYLRVDPFHAFSLDAEGHCEERAEFIVSGWNDFFRPVFDETRLVGIGINDEDGRTLSVSLYDITDLDNASPLLDRAEVEAERSWSEANWDHRAFSVLEDAVDVTADDGTPETGLVLLPYQGYDEDYSGYRSAVQIFTFSDSTLTRRGTMDHGTPVRRSFRTASDVVGNLSEIALSLFGIEDPDDPEELGRVELAPNYTDVLRFGDHRVRVRAPEVWWYDTSADVPPAVVEVIDAEADPDLADAIASFETAANASVYQVGDLLVTVVMDVVDTSEWPYEYRSTIEVWDLGDPTEPALVATLEDDRLRPTYSYYGGPWVDECWDCGRGYWWGPTTSPDVQVIDSGIAFLIRNQEQELLGTEEVCHYWPDRGEECIDPEREDGEREECSFVNGGVTCRSLEGAEPVCTGGYQRCTRTDGAYECEDVDASEVETTENCYEHERYRYWQSFDLVTLDVSEPDDPAMSETFDLPVDNEGVGIVADGNAVWVSFKQPHDVPDDARPYVRYFVQPVDVSDPSEPEMGDPINVPGELLAVNGDTLFTRDTAWGDVVVEAVVAKVVVYEGLAYLQGSHRFEDQQVEQVVLDGDGHVLVTHRTAWSVYYEGGAEGDNQVHLTVLDAGADDLPVLADITLDYWASLEDAIAGRALFEVPGGLLVVNTENGEAPFAQAWFATLGWPQALHLDGRDIVFAAGRYGVYEFDLDEYNLLPPI